MKSEKTVVTISPISFVYLILIIAVAALVWYLSGLVLLVLASIIFAAGLQPSVLRLERFKLPRWLAVAVIIMLFFGILSVIIYLIIPALTGQFSEIVLNLPTYQQRIGSIFVNQPAIAKVIDKTLDLITSKPEIVFTNFGQTAIGFIASLFGFMVFLVLTFYFLLNGDQIAHQLVKYVPHKNKQEEIMQIARESSIKLGHWIRGQVILSLLVFIITYVFLSIMGIQYALTLALFAAVLQFVPFIGGIIGALPTVLTALVVSPTTALVTVAFFMILQTLIGNIIAPELMKKAIGVSPIVLLIAALAGLTLFGPLGMLLAVPVAAVIDVIFDSIGSKYIKNKIASANH